MENQAVLDNNNEAQRLALAKRLREALKDAEITPADLARQLERTPQAVTGWLTTGRISKDRLSAFATATGEELGYLVTGKRAAPPLPKVAQGRGRGEYRAMADLQHPTSEDAQLLSAFRRMAPDRRALLLALAAILSACAIHVEKEARMYDVAEGSIISATFVWEGRPQGTVRATLPGGAQCQGEYSTIQRPTEAWGLIYGISGAALAASNASRGNHGSAVVVCDDKRTIECEYVTAGHTSGNGACRDNRGHTYRLMF